MAQNLCQNDFDVKAFKGKGAFWDVLQHTKTQSLTVWREMRALAEESRVHQSSVYLQVHKQAGLADLGVVSEIRWRMRLHGTDTHLSWIDARRALVGEPVAVQRYYEAIEEYAANLNCLAGILRQTAIRTLQRFVQDDSRTAPELYAGWIRGQITKQGKFRVAVHTV